MMELMERKGTEERRKLPKNVRQIGEPGQGTRVLIEDYAYTYVHQLADANLTCMKTAILVGSADAEQICIQGALEIDMGQEQESWFSNEHWRDIFQLIRDWFDGLEMVGWFLANPGFPTVLTEELQRIHNRHFPGESCVFFQMDALEKEEVFYRRGESGLTPLSGYYIYYEKNDRMQAYMSRQRGGAGIEPEGIFQDRAAVRFRSVMQEKREQNAQKKTMAFLYTASTFLVMVVLVIGVTMINNYDRMENMENAIHQISENLDRTAEENIVSEGTDLEEEALEENRQALAEADSPEEDDGDAEISEIDEEQQEEAVQEAVSQAVQEPTRYQVQAGDTLLRICREQYGDEARADEICQLNELEDSDKIYVGQILLLP